VQSAHQWCIQQLAKKLVLKRETQKNKAPNLGYCFEFLEMAK